MALTFCEYELTVSACVLDVITRRFMCDLAIEKTLMNTQVDPLLQVSVVMPCLNEAETLEFCIEEVQRAFASADMHGEVIVADNGSTDGSQKIARRLGARVVEVSEKGYGAALQGGIKAAGAEFVVMGDADASYDFGHAPMIFKKLGDGFDLVMGNRFLGGIEPGAMPWHHYWIGNPVLSGIGRLFFRCPAGDFHCGLRGFRRDSVLRLNLTTTGMEFASEMVIKATLQGLRIAEVPTLLRPDGRSRPPHLRSWRDGWRHLRFMLLFCPRWLFLFTGLFLFVSGLLVMAGIAVWGSVSVGAASLSVNSSLASAMTSLVGFQLLVSGTFARKFGTTVGILPRNELLDRAESRATLELGVILGVVALIVGATIFGSAFLIWRDSGFGPMTSDLTVSRVIPSITLIMIGIQTIFGSFLISMLGLIPEQHVVGENTTSAS